MHRIKRIEYDDDDLYDEPDDFAGAAEESGGAGDDGLTAEDRDNFATLTPVVRAELDEAGVQVSDREIQDALWHYYWDLGKSVAYLKNARTPRQTAAAPQKPSQQSAAKDKPKSKFDQAAEKSAQKLPVNSKAKSATPANGLAKQTQALKLDSAPASPAQPRVKSKNLNVAQLWADQASQAKPLSAFVVIGHVDHGKSTLMGRLLLDTGAVAQRDIDRYKKQAAELGKASFALAWVMDTGSEERERGVTVDIAQHHFATERADFTILDAPGHRDFVPNMIGGASMADVAVLVVDANQLDSGIKGQTKEHILLARACGLHKVIVAVNKLDIASPPWDKGVFDHVQTEVSKLLASAGFTRDDIVFVPCSGLSGQNVAKPVDPTDDTAWISKASGTLLEELEKCARSHISQTMVSEPLRMQIADVYRGGITNPLSVSGRLAAGNVQVGDAVVVQPSGETAAVKAIEAGGDARDWAVAGQLCALHLTDIDAQHLRAGDVLCGAARPVAVAESFAARFHALEPLLPQSVDVHVGRLHVPGSIAQLVALLDEGGNVARKRPRVVKEGQTASLRIALAAGAPLAVGDRVVLRSAGATIAAGRIDHVGA